MTQLLDFLKTIPIWIWLSAGAVFILLLIFILTFFILNMYHAGLIKKALAKPGKYRDKIAESRGIRYFLRNKGHIENLVKKYSLDSLVETIKLDTILFESLASSRSKKDLQLILDFLPETGLFKCFKTALEKKSLLDYFMKWFNSQQHVTIHKLAALCRGEMFDGEKTFQLFSGDIDPIREMMGDPEWHPRYFSVKVILFDKEKRSQKALMQAFTDPHPLIRRTLAEHMEHENRENLFVNLYDLYVKDPVFEVRQAAYKRIRSDFSDLFDREARTFTNVELLHIIELLDPDSKDDENFALTLFQNDDLELRFGAAGFLAKCGALDRLCLEVDMGDREALDRNSDLLKKASQVNITSFLETVKKTSNKATLLLAAKVLLEMGDRILISRVAEKAFKLDNNQAENRELYNIVIECIHKRGTEKAYMVLNSELLKQKENPALLEILLPAIPDNAGYIILPTLLSFLTTDGFAPKQLLRDTLARLDIAHVLPELLKIIHAERRAYSHEAKKEAFILLGELNKDYCIQTILENMPILPLEEAKDFTKIITRFPKDVYFPRIDLLLQSSDAKIRSSLIAVLPTTENKDFLPYIRKSVKDADPEVRIASFWALADYQDFRSLSHSIAILHDPVERVRRCGASVLGTYGSEEVHANLKDLLYDENEVDTVKISLIKGLGLSKSVAAVDILTSKMEDDGEFSDTIIYALAHIQEKKQFTRLIESFKDGSPTLRERISEVFKKMDERCEKVLVELLKEEISSLKPFIADILEATGYVERLIRRFKHRDPAKRRDASSLLSIIGTKSAFRGIVLAAKDPDEQVRVTVIKALEKLETEEGQDILNELQKDPDKKVRKYTHWALERLKAKQT